MTRLTQTMMVGVLALGIASQAVALSIVLQPGSQTINVGDNTFLDVMIDGLGGSEPSLGAFDFDLTYDPLILSVVSVGYGSYLDLGISGSMQYSLGTLGVIHVDEVSWESAGDLIAAQPSTFKLATLEFTGLAPGSSSIAFSYAALSDESGNSIEDFSISGGSITVASTSVPDPSSTCLLLVLACLSVMLLKWRQGFLTNCQRILAF